MSYDSALDGSAAVGKFSCRCRSACPLAPPRLSPGSPSSAIGEMHPALASRALCNQERLGLNSIAMVDPMVPAAAPPICCLRCRLWKAALDKYKTCLVAIFDAGAAKGRRPTICS